ncbi:MAG: hemerythrin domain-containing protein [Proteobacteria bacterium]|nr:hemerythrin domain-containing protein [Pseudomonadota bacterium]
MLELSKSFELDIQPLDNDHRRMIEIINRVIKLIDDGNPAECTKLVPEFVAFAKRHFLREEAFLKKVGYPKTQKHHDHHRQLDGKLETMIELCQAVGESKVAQDSLRKEMVYFLMDDVINADLDFKAYLTEKGLLKEKS